LVSAGDAYLLEQENEDHVESLQAKLGVLKEVSLQIGEEVKSQNEWFKQMVGTARHEALVYKP
jgi:blocked-early-in-transport protein 1